MKKSQQSGTRRSTTAKRAKKGGYLGRAKQSRGAAQKNKSSHGARQQGVRGTRGAAHEVRVEGLVEGSQRDYAFLVVEGMDKDAFIPAAGLNGAIHGDRVVAVLKPTERGMSATVEKIVSRRYECVVGTFFERRGMSVVIPDEVRIGGEIAIINAAKCGAKHLDKVVVALGERTHDGFSGKVIEVLGQADDKGVDILSIIRSYNLYETFPKAVESEAARVAVPVTQDGIAERTDYREELIFTIDGDDSKDFDDAVCVQQLADGTYRLGVHIADVAHYVTANSALDKEAFKRGTSVYFCDRVLPMLPEKLSNDICSLNEGVDRLTLSVVMTIDPSGTVISHEIREGVIRSCARLTYSKVAKILDGDAELCTQYAALVPSLVVMQRLAKLLSRKRKNRGNIDFELPECQLVLDESGRCVDVLKRERLVSHRIIEEFMLAANETVAEYFAKRNVPFVFRTHEPPPSEKLQALMDLIKALGISFPGDPENPSPRNFDQLLQQVVGSAFEVAVSRTALRTMSKASYTPQNKGHFGLAAEYYCHFTSPIRRYPDLAIHRIIKEFIKNGAAALNKYRQFTEAAAMESSERERLAEKAERDVDDLKKAEYMADKIGCRYQAIVSGVTEWGMFAELDNTVEGMIRVENLPGEAYLHDPRSARLTNGVYSFRIGDRIEIEVLGTYGLKVEFGLA